ncbi:MAG: L-histidine N(alpha)-methyltransferase [Deltaproteobacteria bacterium]|nr:L-histidine N(alpha)-methyltransferase [Deltaproteobacteria bacterium]MBW2359760.1 L-histidine N(alpha)-methyltransferase [Deltaproteobacteria bacterium]
MSSQNAISRFSLIARDSKDHLASFAEAVEAGLQGRPKSIPCRFLYDEEGSQLFEQICEVPEYYLTRAERSILEKRATEIAACFDGPLTLAELGSGNAAKTRLLIEACLHAHGRLRYVPVDISPEILESSSLALLDDYPALEVRAIATEYRASLPHVRADTEYPKLIAWLGSSIGNLTRDEAAAFLHSVRGNMSREDRVLLGIDLRKSPRELEAAYDDAAGVTSRFSLNLLQRLNRELDANFDIGAFRHSAVYCEAEGRVHIEIVSRRAQRVRIDALDMEVEFAADEGIHTENAFKYSAEEIERLAAAADLELDRGWSDVHERFSLNLLAPA